MSTVAKILVVLNLGLAAVFLGSASNYLGNQDNYRVKWEDKTEELIDYTAEKEKEYKELEGNLRSVNTQKTEAQQQRTIAQTESQRLQEEVRHLREAFNQVAANHTRAQRSVDALTNSLNAARDQNANLSQSNNNLRTNLLKAQEDRDAKVAMVNALQLQLENETKARTAALERVSALQENNKRQAFELEYFKTRFPGHVASVQPAHSGMVLACDNGANVFIISLGKEDEVQPGFQYIASSSMNGQAMRPASSSPSVVLPEHESPTMITRRPIGNSGLDFGLASSVNGVGPRIRRNIDNRRF